MKGSQSVGLLGTKEVDEHTDVATHGIAAWLVASYLTSKELNYSN